jgi:predicted Holliday junction resolvase-like endonuclease
MARIEINGDIGSLLNFYKEETRLFGRCPHCQEPFRLSEVKLTYGKEPPRDLLTRMKKERARLEEELEQRQEELEQLQADIEDIELTHQNNLETQEQEWKTRVSFEVERQLLKTIREVRKKAIAKSRAGQLGKTLEKIAPVFSGFGHHPYDVRPMFDPVDFVVFDGYFQGEVTDITFVEFKTGQGRTTKIQDSIRNAIEKKRVGFEIRRLTKETINMLTKDAAPRKIQYLAD